MSVRVRFAPSPTGYLHVGGLRTALYNFLFAKHHDGTMIIRIEDTDRTRLVEDAQENLIQSMQWCGIEFDEGPGFGGDKGPYIQSERFHLYREYAEKLIANDTAYYAFDSAEELTAMRERQQGAGLAPKYDRSTMKNQYTIGAEETKKLLTENAPHVIRLKVPTHEEIHFSDQIRGEVVVKGKDVDDQILLKSDGFPTYHLANVVDDHLMEITHVIRGEEWLPSTPKHVLLYKAFGWEMPKFGHLPLLLNDNKSKLSKRHGDVAVEDFKEKGYFKEAFVNFIALLGWNPSGEQEIFTMQELIDGFNLSKVNKGGAIFDRRKLEWMNSQYLRLLPLERLYEQLEPKLKQHEIENQDKQYVMDVINLLKERINFVEQVPEFGDYMFDRPKSYDEKYVAKQWKEKTPDIILPLIEKFKELDEFTHDKLDQVAQAYLQENELGFGKIGHPLRIMITGKSVGANMFDTMALLGKDECLARFDQFLSKKEKGEI